MLGLLLVFAVAAVLRLGFWQVAMAPELQARAQARLQSAATEPALRGDILDRHGRVLATTAYRDTLAAWPVRIQGERRTQVIGTLVSVLGYDDEQRALLEEKLDGKREYAVLVRELTVAQSDQIREGIGAGRLTGLSLEPHAVRVYPNPGGQPDTTLASQLLGFVMTNDGSGQYGIEGRYDAILAGEPRRIAAARDRYGRSLQSSEMVIDPGRDGQDVTLTIDATLQLALEKELYSAWIADDAKRVSGVVLDPDTGEVLAWASVPGYDANQFARVANRDPKLFQDPILSEVYEPGSVMKMFTAAAALSTGTVTPSTIVNDKRAISFGSTLVRNADKKGMGKIPFRDVIAYSRNVGVSRVAARLGRTTAKSSLALYRTWAALGIGQRTGIDLTGEVAGIVPDPREKAWTALDLANRSFGQGVAVTLIQLATAFTPMLDGGLRVQPHLLRAVGDQQQERMRPQRVLDKQVARQTRALMTHVTAAVPWYAQGSLIPHYEVGGKTGTAQIWRPAQGRYDPDTFDFTFVGYVGGDEPQAVVAVRIHETDPDIKGYGDLRLNITSYELFRRVARDIIATQDLRKSSDPDAGMPEPRSAAERVLTPERYAESRGRRR